MTVNMYIATCAWLLLVFGFLKRRQRRIHIPCMACAISLDLALVLYLQVTRDAVQTAASFTLSFWEQCHIGFSTLAVILYVPVLYFGVKLVKSPSNELRKKHIRVALPALACRTLGFFLMFSMIK